jgi:uncharacterized protein (TIGR00255 family)
MIKSMTGFGLATYEDEQIRVQVEVKSLNAKQADVSMRLPKGYEDRELAWKNLVVEKLQRGRISLLVNCNAKQPASQQIHFDKSLLEAYYDMLHALAKKLGADTDIFSMALKLPGVMQGIEEPTGESGVTERIEKVIQDAVAACDQSRQEEGTILAKRIEGYLANIKQSLLTVERLDTGRISLVRSKLADKLKSLQQIVIDENRLAQELIYYIERMDITEETVRLEKHLAYFDKVMGEEMNNGKKLGFIAQEMGREMNTIGAKANDAAMQQQVVWMKDELEKIKEQLQNIL